MNLFSPTHRLTTIAFLSATGIALFVLESYIPMPLPFLKIGLANISSVIALVMLGAAPMFGVVLFRVVAGSLLSGSFLSPAFVLAIAAGIVAAAAMATARLALKNLFSPFGLSLIGSFVHVGVQLLIVRYVYVQNAAVGHLLPLLLVTALIGGAVVGGISLRLLNALKGIRL